MASMRLSSESSASVIPPASLSPSAAGAGFDTAPPARRVASPAALLDGLRNASTAGSPPPFPHQVQTDAPLVPMAPVAGSPVKLAKQRQKASGASRRPSPSRRHAKGRKKQQQQQQRHHPAGSSPAAAPAPASAPSPTRSLMRSPSAHRRRAGPNSSPAASHAKRSMHRPASAGALRPVPRVTTTIPLYDTGHLLSPGASHVLHTEGSVMGHPGTFSVLTESFSSPTNVGFHRPTSAIFPRAVRDIHKQQPVDSGSIATSTVGGVGRPAPLSRLRNPPAFTLATSTREREAARWRARDPTVENHGPADYVADDTGVRPARPATVIGRSRREPAARGSDGPGPGLMTPPSELRRNRSAVFGTAKRSAIVPDATATPSPLSYRPERAVVGHLRSKGPAAHFGTSRRKHMAPTTGPGVGEYNTRAGTFVSGFGRRAPSFGFSTAKRF